MKFLIVGKDSKKWSYFCEGEAIINTEEWLSEEQSISIDEVIIFVLPYLSSLDIELINNIKTQNQTVLLFPSRNNLKYIRDFSDYTEQDFQFKEEWGTINVSFETNNLELPYYQIISKAPNISTPLLKSSNDRTVMLEVGNLIISCLFPNEVLLSLYGKEFINYLKETVFSKYQKRSYLADSIEKLFSEGENRPLIEASIFTLLFSQIEDDNILLEDIFYEDIKHTIDIDPENGLNFLKLLKKGGLIDYNDDDIDEIHINYKKYREIKEYVLSNKEKYPLLRIYLE